MHITDLQIDRFGVWRDLTLPLAGPGLNVLYGPNEAGKSTLMRFVKAALYGGLPPRAEAEAHAETDGEVAGGSLRFIREGVGYTVRRRMTAGDGGQVQLIGPDDTPLPPARLGELLSGTSETVFERVFAVDLYELQELATLDHEELAGHVYGLSLGGRGRKLLAAVNDLRRQREAILSRDGRSGRLAKLLDYDAALREELRALPDLPAIRSDLLGQRQAVDAEIASLKRRRVELQHEQRGRRFLDRVYPAWNQVREYAAELSKLPFAASLPADGLARLDAVERDCETLKRKRDDARRQAQSAKQRAKSLGPAPEIVRAETAVRAMLGMRDWLKESVAARQAAAEAMSRASETARIQSEKLGPEWAPARLAAVDTSPSAQLALLKAARAYRLAIGRRADLRNTYRRLQQSTAKREAHVRELLERLGKTPDAAASELRRRLSSLETLAELRAKEAAYEHRGKALRERLEQLAETLEVPPWVTLVLALFALGGAVFAVVGLATGVATSAVAGAAYLLLGLTCGSIAVKLRSHFVLALKEIAQHIRHERSAEEVELRKIREEIARLNGDAVAGPALRQSSQLIPLTEARKSKPPSVADSVRDAVKAFSELDELVDDQDRLRRRRKLLTKLRERLRTAQQATEAARQGWCQTLAKVGLNETLDVEASLTAWQNAAEAVAGRAVAGPVAREHAMLDGAIRAFGTQLEEMGRRIQVGNVDANRPVQVLDEWERALDPALRKYAERKNQVEEFKRLNREAAEADGRLKQAHRRRQALLTAVGVASRAEYEQRLQAAEQRRELEELFALAESELESLAATEPELAIVEEDLLAFRPDENATALNRLVRQQDELDAKLESAHERRGGIAQRLDELEADDRSAALRRRSTRVDSLLRRTTERLLAASLAERAAEQARAAYERDRQPPVLAAASESLARLTRNRYVRIWAPLGERTLRIDDDHGRTLAVEQLSGGTREQLFLALRLGLVRHAGERGVTLPLILDDVFVNFDQLRTEAAFETLRDFADEGRQVLFFTCHLHLAHLAEGRGIEPIWLPGHQPPMQQRLAG